MKHRGLGLHVWENGDTAAETQTSEESSLVGEVTSLHQAH